MGGRDSSFAALLQFIESAIKDFPDIRTGKNTVYEIRDAVLSAFFSFLFAMSLVPLPSKSHECTERQE
jgi:hypothetical protein